VGTSVEQIEKTYGHLLPDAAEFTRSATGRLRRRHDEEAAEN
jgi:hypothetical protein